MNAKIRFFLIALPLLAFLQSCGEEGSGEQAVINKISELVAERNEINKKISQLESSLSQEEGDQLKVDTAILVPQYFNHEIEVQGKVESDKNILVPSESTGVIERIYVKEGDRVNKGQVLLVIDNAELRAQREEIVGNLELAASISERTERLYKKEIGSEVEYLEAKNRKESLQSQLKNIDERLAKSRVKAPFSGKVDAVHAKEGEATKTGDGVVRVVHQSDLKLVLSISEDYILSIKKGQEVNVNFPTINQSMTLKVSSVSEVIDPRTRSFDIEIKLPERKDLYPNMYAVASIDDYTTDHALLIPDKNVFGFKEEFYVFMAKKQGQDYYAELRKVKVGKTFKGYTEILSGVKTGEAYIKNGYTQISDKEKLVIDN